MSKLYRVSLNLTKNQLESLRTMVVNQVSENHPVGTNATRDEIHICLEIANALLDLRQRNLEEKHNG